MSKSNRYFPEPKERVERLADQHKSDYDSEWATTESKAEKIGCTLKAASSLPNAGNK